MTPTRAPFTFFFLVAAVSCLSAAPAGAKSGGPLRGGGDEKPAASAPAGGEAVTVDVDWPAFLGRHDPVWTRMPERWFDAPFLGNGLLGTLVRLEGKRAVRWDVGHSYVHDHRPVREEDYGVRAPEILKKGRLPIGHFLLRTRGGVTGCDLRLDLWNAELAGTISTEEGEIALRTLVHAKDMVFLVELEGRGGEAGCALEFVPEKAVSPRYADREKQLPGWFKKDYPPNPDPVLRETGEGTHLCVQRLAAGGMTVTAWKSAAEDERRMLFVTAAHTLEGSAVEKALEQLAPALKGDRSAWIEAHRAWWHAYYPESFLSFPDPLWEGFYWIQMYKGACATRADRALIDNQGPWLQPTGWNGTWWNLNVQLSYAPWPAANRLHLAESLCRHLARNVRHLVENVDPPFRADSAGITRNTSMLDLAGKVGRPGGWKHPNKDIGSEVGNLAWTCHNLYRVWRCSMDEALLRDLLYPLLARAVNYYRHFLEKGGDGKLHLPPTHSPEYGNAPDANYDLSLIRWGCATLVELARRLGRDEEETAPWKEILAELADFPRNEHGLMVGRGVGFDRSHRHFSHLLMIYPLHVLTPENGCEALIRTSFERWRSFRGGAAGYTYTAGASFCALLRDGDRALEFLERFRLYMGASTMYYEGGRRGLPVMETPLHAAQAIQELFLQSWGGVIRLFPAVPGRWKDAVFHDLRAEGAFLVSAERRGGRTRWIRIRSLAGEPCVIETDLSDPRPAAGTSVRPEPLGGGRWRIPLAKGKETVLVPGGAAPERIVRPVPPPRAEGNLFGLK